MTQGLLNLLNRLKTCSILDWSKRRNSWMFNAIVIVLFWMRNDLQMTQDLLNIGLEHNWRARVELQGPSFTAFCIVYYRVTWSYIVLYIVLHCNTLCNIVYYCVALCYKAHSSLYCIVYYIVLHCVTLCYTVIHCVIHFILLCNIVYYCVTLCYKAHPSKHYTRTASWHSQLFPLYLQSFFFSFLFHHKLLTLSLISIS